MSKSFKVKKGRGACFSPGKGGRGVIGFFMGGGTTQNLKQILFQSKICDCPHPITVLSQKSMNRFTTMTAASQK